MHRGIGGGVRDCAVVGVMDWQRLIDALITALFFVGLPIGLLGAIVLVIYLFGAVAGISFVGLLFFAALVACIYESAN